MLDTESRFFKILCYKVKNIWAIYIWDKSREGRSVLCNSLVPSVRKWSSKWNGILVNSEPNNKPGLIQAFSTPGGGEPGFHLPTSWNFNTDALIPVIPKPYTLSSRGHCIWPLCSITDTEGGCEFASRWFLNWGWGTYIHMQINSVS